mmetsp:Transcript_8687/g.21920  ORF Transcript_8687/g.21920 Transcript_8687/m.21920 type:complete len:348 (+) Transcript_8687:503-1546(+)
MRRRCGGAAAGRCVSWAAISRVCSEINACGPPAPACVMFTGTANAAPALGTSCRRTRSSAGVPGCAMPTGPPTKWRTRRCRTGSSGGYSARRRGSSGLVSMMPLAPAALCWYTSTTLCRKMLLCSSSEATSSTPGARPSTRSPCRMSTMPSRPKPSTRMTTRSPRACIVASRLPRSSAAVSSRLCDRVPSSSISISARCGQGGPVRPNARRLMHSAPPRPRRPATMRALHSGRGGGTLNLVWHTLHFSARSSSALRWDASTLSCHLRRHLKCTYCWVPMQLQGDSSSPTSCVSSKQIRHMYNSPTCLPAVSAPRAVFSSPCSVAVTVIMMRSGDGSLRPTGERGSYS